MAKITMNGKTLAEIAKEEGITYEAAWQRYKAESEGRRKRESGKRRVVWTGKDGETQEFESLAELAKFLGVSREYARRLVNKRDSSL